MERVNENVGNGSVCPSHHRDTEAPQKHRGDRPEFLCGSVDFCDSVVWSGAIDPLPKCSSRIDGSRLIPAACHDGLYSYRWSLESTAARDNPARPLSSPTLKVGGRQTAAGRSLRR